MALYLSPIANDQQMDANGDPLVGGKIYTYLAGSTTPVSTYTDSTGVTAQANPIILNSLGLSASPIWLTGGVSYKFVIKDSADVTLRTIDGIAGINDVSSTAQEWSESGLVPTYISTTQFSVPGDQTSLLQVNRRLRCDVTAGFAYGRISVSSFAAGITTITMVNDSTPLDSGLSSIAYGFLSFSPSSVPYALYASAGYNVDITGSPAFRNFISGLTLSTAGSSAAMSIAAGVAMDSTNTYLMQPSSVISKTTSAWAVGSGNGGLDTGSIANNTWYHWYVIRRPDAGIVDVVFSTSASSPTLPTNYTQYRRIGSGRTNGSAQWTKFVQDGDNFRLDAAAADISAVNPGTAAVSRTLTVPTGVRVKAFGNVSLETPAGGAAEVQAYLSDLSVSDEAPAAATGPLGQVSVLPVAATANHANAPWSVYTNTSSQIRSRINFSAAGYALRISTLGWIDSRGKDA